MAIVIEKATSRESVAESNGSDEEAVRITIPSY